jgi:hypothetical protein
LRRFSSPKKFGIFISLQGEAFFGASEATIFSKRGSPRKGS